MSSFGIRNTDDDKTHIFDYTGSPATGLPVYEGITEAGGDVAKAMWRIKKYTYDGQNQCTNIQWAQVTPQNNAIWNNRATYTYS